MSNFKIFPQFSEEENKIALDFIENASKRELVHAIREMQKVYAEQTPDIDESFRHFEKEIAERDVLNQQHEALKKCSSEWHKYETALLNYKVVLVIREKYAEFKRTFKKKTVFISFITAYREKYFPYYDEAFIRKAVLSEGAKNYIKEPQAPQIIHSTDEIEVVRLNNDTSLESIGKDSLKYLLTVMLKNADSPSASEVPVALFFLTRKYAGRSHKKEDQNLLFTTTLLSTPELIADNKRLLAEIRRTEQDCKKVLEEIGKDK